MATAFFDFVHARLWRETSRPPADIAALGADELLAQAALFSAAPAEFQTWLNHLEAVAVLLSAGEPPADESAAGENEPPHSKIPSAEESPTRRAMSAAGAFIKQKTIPARPAG